MSFVAVAIGTSVVGIGSSILGANATKDAAAQSAAAMLEANKANIDFQKWLYEDQKTQALPWYEAGSQAITDLTANVKNGSYSMDPSLLNQQQFTPERFTGEVDLKSDPSYQFRLDEGLKAANNSASAAGSVQSGAQLKALNNYAQNAASTEYAAAYDRAYNTNALNNSTNLNAITANNAGNLNTWNALSAEKTAEYNRLAGIAGAGQTALSTINNSANTMASQVGASTINSGNALSDMYNTSGAATSGMYSGIATSVNSAAQNALLANYLK